MNRALGTIDLYLDGELIRQMNDTSPNTLGTGVTIVRSRGDQSVSQLSHLKAFTWDAVSQIQLLEQPNSQDADSIVDSSGKRFSGALKNLVKVSTPDKRPTIDEAEKEKTHPEDDNAPSTHLLHFSFESPYSEEPVTIPTEKTRIIYFKKEGQKSVESLIPKYELELSNNGVVSATQLSLNADSATIEHPLLGTLQLKRAWIRTIHYLPSLDSITE